MWSRRAFLGLSGAAGTYAATHTFNGLAHLEAAGAAVSDRRPEEVAQDEFYWREIQEAFTLDRTLINLNNGNTCPSPRVVHAAGPVPRRD
jgi:isopenicillin-N epimerase